MLSVVGLVNVCKRRISGVIGLCCICYILLIACLVPAGSAVCATIVEVADVESTINPGPQAGQALDTQWRSFSINDPESVLRQVEAELDAFIPVTLARKNRLLNTAIRMLMYLHEFDQAQVYADAVTADDLMQLSHEQKAEFYLTRLLLFTKIYDIKRAQKYIDATATIMTHIDNLELQAWYDILQGEFLLASSGRDKISESVAFLLAAKAGYKRANNLKSAAYTDIRLSAFYAKSYQQEEAYRHHYLARQQVTALNDSVLEAVFLQNQLNIALYFADGQLARAAVELYDKLVSFKNPEQEFYFTSLRAEYDFTTHRSYEAIQLLLSVVDFYTKGEKTRYIASIHGLLGRFYKGLKDFKPAMTHLFKAYDYHRAFGNKVLQGVQAFHLCQVYDFLHQYKKAIDYCKQVLELTGRKENINAVLSHYTIVGILKKIGHDARTDEMSFHRQEAIRIAASLQHPTTTIIASTLTSDYMIEQKQYDLAVQALQRTEPVLTKNDNEMYKADIYARFGFLYLLMVQPERSEMYYKKALQAAKAIDFKDQLITIYQGLSDAYHAQGKFEQALSVYKKYMALKSSVEKKNNDRAFAEIAGKYEDAKKQKEIIQLNKDNALKEATITKQKMMHEKQKLLLNIAIVIAFFVFASLFLVLTLYFSRRENKRVKLQVQERTLELEKSSQSMSKLFNKYVQLYQNFSHEFRTPINIIQGNIEHLEIEKSEGLRKEILTTLARNASSLAHLIEQTIELSRIQSNHQNDLEVRPAQTVMEIVDQFRTLATSQSKKIMVAAQTEASLAMPALAFQQVVKNLLSNAIKYTKEGDAIQVSLTVLSDKRQVMLEVKDDGCGIESRHLAKIFDRFYRIVNKKYDPVPGTGLGLAIIKEHVEACGGTINVASEPDVYTVFTVNIPIVFHMDEEKAKDNGPAINTAMINSEISYMGRMNKAPPLSSIHNVPWKRLSKQDDSNRAMVLVVEDNPDMRALIASNLEPRYRVIEATDGDSGLKVAISHIPDMIISDIDMPIKDGFQLLSAVKTRLETSHVPVVMLTAKTTLENRVTGWHFDADGYLTKPFDRRELLAICQSILDNRKTLKALWQGGNANRPQPVPISDNISVKFMSNLDQYLEQCMDSTDMKVACIAGSLHMSTRSFQRKLKSVTGQSPSDYIRGYKMERSRRLIHQGYSVSEVAARVGFNSHSHFTQSYKSYFNVLPSRDVRL